MMVQKRGQESYLSTNIQIDIDGTRTMRQVKLWYGTYHVPRTSIYVDLMPPLTNRWIVQITIESRVAEQEINWYIWR